MEIFSKLRKTAIASIAAVSLLPSYSFPRMAEVISGGERRIVEIDEAKKKIQLDVEKKDERFSLMSSFVAHQKSQLELGLNELDYELFNLGKESIRGSKELSSKIKTFSDLFGIDFLLPWPALVVKDLDAKLFGGEEAWSERKIAKNYLKRIEKDELNNIPEFKNEYEILAELEARISSASDMIRDLKNSTDPIFILNKEEISDLRKALQSWNIGKIEGLVRGIKFDKAKENVENHFYDSEIYKNYAASLKKIKKQNLEKDLSKYEIRNSPAKVLFDGQKSLKFDGASSTGRIKLEKILESDGGYRLRISLMVDDYASEKEPARAFVLNKSKTRLFLFYPPSCVIGTSDQAVYAMRDRNMDGKLEARLAEAKPLGDDKIVTMKLEAAEYLFDEAFDLIFKGYLTKAKNVKSWAYEKFIDIVEGPVLEKRDQLVENIKENYKVKEIPLYPSSSLASAYLISFPVSNQKDSIYAMINLGIQDWNESQKDSLDDIVIKIDPGISEVYVPQDDIPIAWKNRVQSFCQSSAPQTSVANSGASGNEVNRAANSLYNDLANIVPSFIALQFRQMMNDLQQNTGYSGSGNSGSYNIQRSCDPSKLLEDIAKDVKRLRRKDFSWILSEPWIIPISAGKLKAIMLKGSYGEMSYSGAKPEKIITYFGKSLVDRNYARMMNFEQFNDGYCDLVLSKDRISYDCFPPVFFDERMPHLELTNLKDPTPHPMKGLYFQTKMKFDGANLRIE